MGVYLGTNAVNILGGQPIAEAATIEALTITENGTYVAGIGVDGYSPIVVNVSSGIDGNNLEYGIIDATSSRVGVGKVGSMIIK